MQSVVSRARPRTPSKSTNSFHHRQQEQQQQQPAFLANRDGGGGSSGSSSGSSRSSNSNSNSNSNNSGRSGGSPAHNDELKYNAKPMHVSMHNNNNNNNNHNHNHNNSRSNGNNNHGQTRLMPSRMYASAHSSAQKHSNAEHDSKRKLQSKLQEMEQQLLAKNIQHDIMVNKEEMLAKRLNTKDLRINNLKSDVSQLRSTIVTKTETQESLMEQINELQLEIHKLRKHNQKEKELKKQQRREEEEEERQRQQQQQQQQRIDIVRHHSESDSAVIRGILEAMQKAMFDMNHEICELKNEIQQQPRPLQPQPHQIVVHDEQKDNRPETDETIFKLVQKCIQKTIHPTLKQMKQQQQQCLDSIENQQMQWSNNISAQLQQNAEYSKTNLLQITAEIERHQSANEQNRNNNESLAILHEIQEKLAIVEQEQKNKASHIYQQIKGTKHIVEAMNKEVKQALVAASNTNESNIEKMQISMDANLYAFKAGIVSDIVNTIKQTNADTNAQMQQLLQQTSAEQNQKNRHRNRNTDAFDDDDGNDSENENAAQASKTATTTTAKNELLFAEMSKLLENKFASISYNISSGNLNYHQNFQQIIENVNENHRRITNNQNDILSQIKRQSNEQLLNAKNHKQIEHEFRIKVQAMVGNFCETVKLSQTTCLQSFDQQKKEIRQIIDKQSNDLTQLEQNLLSNINSRVVKNNNEKNEENMNAVSLMSDVTNEKISNISESMDKMRRRHNELLQIITNTLTSSVDRIENGSSKHFQEMYENIINAIENMIIMHQKNSDSDNDNADDSNNNSNSNAAKQRQLFEESKEEQKEEDNRMYLLIKQLLTQQMSEMQSNFNVFDKQIFHKLQEFIQAHHESNNNANANNGSMNDSIHMNTVAIKDMITQCLKEFIKQCQTILQQTNSCQQTHMKQMLQQNKTLSKVQTKFQHFIKDVKQQISQHKLLFDQKMLEFHNNHNSHHGNKNKNTNTDAYADTDTDDDSDAAVDANAGANANATATVAKIKVKPITSLQMEHIMNNWFQHFMQETQKLLVKNIANHEPVQNESNANANPNRNCKPNDMNIIGIQEIIENVIRHELLRDVHSVRDMCNDIHKQSQQLPHIIVRSKELLNFEKGVNKQLSEMKIEFQRFNLLTMVGDSDSDSGSVRKMKKQHQKQAMGGAAAATMSQQWLLFMTLKEWLQCILTQLTNTDNRNIILPSVPSHAFVIFILTQMAWNTFAKGGGGGGRGRGSGLGRRSHGNGLGNNKPTEIDFQALPKRNHRNRNHNSVDDVDDVDDAKDESVLFELSDPSSSKLRIIDSSNQLLTMEFEEECKQQNNTNSNLVQIQQKAISLLEEYERIQSIHNLNVLEIDDSDGNEKTDAKKTKKKRKKKKKNGSRIRSRNQFKVLLIEWIETLLEGNGNATNNSKQKRKNRKKMKNMSENQHNLEMLDDMNSLINAADVEYGSRASLSELDDIMICRLSNCPSSVICSSDIQTRKKLQTIAYQLNTVHDTLSGFGDANKRWCSFSILCPLLMQIALVIGMILMAGYLWLKSLLSKPNQSW